MPGDSQVAPAADAAYACRHHEDPSLWSLGWRSGPRQAQSPAFFASLLMIPSTRSVLSSLSVPVISGQTKSTQSPLHGDSRVPVCASSTAVSWGRAASYTSYPTHVNKKVTISIEALKSQHTQKAKVRSFRQGDRIVTKGDYSFIDTSVYLCQLRVIKVIGVQHRVGWCRQGIWGIEHSRKVCPKS